MRRIEYIICLHYRSIKNLDLIDNKLDELDKLDKLDELDELDEFDEFEI